MNWSRIALSVVLPLAAVVPIAALLWRRRQPLLGTVVGAGLLFVCGLIFGGVEYVDGIRFRMECERLNLPCRPSSPSDFVRISTYGLVAMTQVMALFVLSSIVEKRRERAHYDSRWR